MAEIIPTINSFPGKSTFGEKRLARKIEATLNDNCLCWYDIPVGKSRRYPDFIILNPERGLLFLEVKDWSIQNILQIDKCSVKFQDNDGIKIKSNPFEQVRQSGYSAINQLERDIKLQQDNERYKGKLCVPYSWGVVFSNITRRQLNLAIPLEIQEEILPPHQVICSDEMTESVSKQDFSDRVWKMFRYDFKKPLEPSQIDRIRWHLFPEIRINHTQLDLFGEETTKEQGSSYSEPPEIIKIMDIQQELLARSLGEGHRVIHGVAGSGKTLILLYRCLHLAAAISTPILVICFNVTLAAKLRKQLAERGLSDKIEIFHFHGWCINQVNKYNLPLQSPEKEIWESYVDTVIWGAEEGRLPLGQYGAILVDEGHDFDSAWLSLITKMVDEKTNALLFMYDDAQSIYKKRAALRFSLASVGIQALGRTSILKLNYRNTKEILNFSYAFSKQYFDSHDDEHMAFMQPEAVGVIGHRPVIKSFTSLSEEISHLITWINNERSRGVQWNDIAIICTSIKIIDRLKSEFSNKDIPCNFLSSSYEKKKYNPTDDKICVIPLPSSKGLEFNSVAVIDSSHLIEVGEDLTNSVRRLYVGFTRATQHLLVSWHQKNSLSAILERTSSIK